MLLPTKILCRGVQFAFRLAFRFYPTGSRRFSIR